MLQRKQNQTYFFLNSDRSYLYMMHFVTDSTYAFFFGTVICISPRILTRKGAFLPWCVLFFAEYRSQKTEMVDLSLLHCFIASVCDGLLCFCSFFKYPHLAKTFTQNQHNFCKCDYMTISMFGIDIFTEQFFLGFPFSISWTLDPYQYILDANLRQLLACFLVEIPNLLQCISPQILKSNELHWLILLNFQISLS